MAEQLFPPRAQGRAIRSEGQPIPAPTYLREGGGVAELVRLFGDASRVVVINGCLGDVRAAEPDATSYRVAEWIDAYLTYYDQLRAAAPSQEGTPHGKV